MSDFLGKNGLQAREMFIERNYFDGYALAELANGIDLQSETLQIKDFRKNEKLLVGRVDPRGNPILVNSNYLAAQEGQIGSPNFSALNFVISAFQGMKGIFDRDLRLGKIDSDSEALGELQIKKGFVDPKQRYINYLKTKNDDFMFYITSLGRMNDIVDFESFVEVYMDFVNFTAIAKPITETMYILTKRNTILSSGLALEIYEGDYSDDDLKIELFYRDKNFEYLKNLAYNHGFVIDKHVPWRLVADLNSPNLIRFAEPFISIPETLIGATSIIGLMFDQPHIDDLEDIANLMVDAYNLVTSQNPVTKIRVPSATASPSSPISVFSKCKKTKIIQRIQTSVEEVSLKPASYWIDKYVKIRNAETGLGYDDATVNVIIKNASDLINSFDTIAAMRYIASKFDNVAHLEGSLFYDITRIEMSQDPNATESSVKERVQRSVQDSNFVQY